MFLVYEIIVELILLLLYPALVVVPRWRTRLSDRLGNWAPIVYDRLRGRPVIWAHCASVGEFMAARPLLERLLDEFPDRALLVTTMTTTGLEQAERALGSRAATALIPLDSYWFLRRVFHRVRPETVLVFETELWPQFLRMAHKSGARILLVNGRISARSFGRYRMVRRLLAPIFARFDLFLMNGEESAERIRALGAPADRVQVLGNVKWAGLQAPGKFPAIASWPEDAEVVVAGSTHAGEEEQVLDLFEDLRQYRPALRLILAPRHPQRVADVERLLGQRGFRWKRRSRNGAEDCDVFLLDTVGELPLVYGRGTVCFLGGSLVPIGGHNMLEAAAARRPVVYGPHVGNFAEVAALLEARGAALRGRDWKDCARILRALLADPVARERMGEAGAAAVAEQGKILERYVDVIGGRVRARTPV